LINDKVTTIKKEDYDKVMALLKEKRKITPIEGQRARADQIKKILDKY
jgi:hypothetical protein